MDRTLGYVTIEKGKPLRFKPARDRARFIVYEDRLGDFRWGFVAANGLIVADSAEGYATSGNTRRAVRRMRRDLSSMPVVGP